LWDAEEGKGALWLDLDWELALTKGMEYINMPFSGQWDFIDTEMYLPVNHMVSPASEALQCSDCHTRANSRMESITGVYIPGKSRFAALDTFGVLLIILSFLGVFSHAILRYVSTRKNNHR